MHKRRRVSPSALVLAHSLGMDTEDLYTWQLRDPAALLAEIDNSHNLRLGTTLLALVDDASRTQVLQRSTPFELPSDLPWFDVECTVGEEALKRLGLEQWSKPRDPKSWPTVVPVITRSGRCVARRGDLAITQFFRYVNGFDAFVGSPLLVTPFGWCDLLEEFGGAEPRCMA